MGSMTYLKKVLRKVRTILFLHLSPTPPQDFNPALYLYKNSDVAEANLDPVRHYLGYGRFEKWRAYPQQREATCWVRAPLRSAETFAFGLMATLISRREFDSVSYLQANPDLELLDISLERHYVLHGRREGRELALQPVTWDFGGIDRNNPARPSVLVVCHEASRTGAPMAGLALAEELAMSHDVFALFLGDGPLIQDFAKVCQGVVLCPDWRHPLVPIELRRLRVLLQELRPSLVISNSVETWTIVREVYHQGFASLGLLHEFPHYTFPYEKLATFLMCSDGVVFSSELQRNLVRESQAILDSKFFEVTSVLRQGVSPSRPLRMASTTRRGPAVLSVVGAGAVQPRKGVDLFLQLAVRSLAMSGLNARFTWIGSWDDEAIRVSDPWLSYQRSLLPPGLVSFLPECSPEELEDLISRADVFALTSRIDPLPNVALLALMHGTPVVSFECSSGIPEVQAALGLPPLVAPHQDVHRMAELLNEVRSSGALLSDSTRASAARARELMRPSAYVERLQGIHSRAAGFLNDEKASIEIIASSGAFDHEFYHPPHFNPAECRGDETCIRDYVRQWRAAGRRRPRPGFNPEIFRQRNPGEHLDPFAAFLQHGEPDGPWVHRLLESSLVDSGTIVEPIGPTVLHLHAHYVEEAEAWIESIDFLPHEIFIVSATSRDVRAQLARVCERLGVAADIRVDAGPGRNLGSFFRLLRGGEFDNAKAVMHIHTKRSSHSDRVAVLRWKEFLRANLTDGEFGQWKMHQRVMRAVAHADGPDIVYPSDPNLVGWTQNMAIADNMFSRISTKSLSAAIDFPVGAMFAAKTEALRWMLVAAREDEFPEEPVPYDGTTLHAVERLLGAVPEVLGLTTWNTYVSGVTR